MRVSVIEMLVFVFVFFFVFFLFFCFCFCFLFCFVFQMSERYMAPDYLLYQFTFIIKSQTNFILYESSCKIIVGKRNFYFTSC